MIVNDVVGRDDHVGNGAVATFAYTFGILDERHIEVLVGGVSKLLNTDYTVAGVGNDSGGTVTFAFAPTGDVVLRRRQPVSSTSRYPINEEFPATRIENDFAKQAMISQMLREMIGRGIRFSEDSALADAIIPDPVSIATFLRVASLNPLVLDWATLTSGGSLTLPLAMSQGGTGASYADANVFAAAFALARWGSSGITPSGAVLTLPNPLTGNHVIVGAGNFSSISTAGVPTGAIVILHYATGGNVLTDGASLLLEGRTNYTSAAGDRSIFVLAASGWVELLRIPLHVAGNATKVRFGNGTWGSLPTQFGPSGVVQGLTCSNATGDPTNDLTIDIGDAFSDEANPASRVSMYLSSALTKQLDATWAAGNNAGGRVSGQSLADGTWHVFLFKRSGGAIDVCFSNSLTFTTPDSGTNRVLIMSMIRVGGAWRSFTQEKDWVSWTTPTLDLAFTNPGSASHLATLAVPTGLKFMARYNVGVVTSGLAIITYFSDPATTDMAITNNMATSPLAQMGLVNGNHLVSFRQVETLTNTNGQVRYRCAQSDGGTIIRAVTLGFWHRRGRG